MKPKPDKKSGHARLRKASRQEEIRTTLKPASVSLSTTPPVPPVPRTIHRRRPLPAVPDEP